MEKEEYISSKGEIGEWFGGNNPGKGVVKLELIGSKIVHEMSG
jgi:hypothetical protein